MEAQNLNNIPDRFHIQTPRQSDPMYCFTNHSIQSKAPHGCHEYEKRAMYSFVAQVHCNQLIVHAIVARHLH